MPNLAFLRDRVELVVFAALTLHPAALAVLERLAVAAPSTRAACAAPLGVEPAPVARATPPSDATPQREAPAPAEPWVRRVPGGEYEVDRGFLEALAASQDGPLRTRIVPDHRHGKVVGVRLAGVLPGSPLAELGLRNGDSIEAVNGYDLTSPDKALEAYARLRSADHITVRLERRGAPVELDYHIR